MLTMVETHHGRGPESGRARTLAETAAIMYRSGLTDRLLTPKDVAVIESRALAKIRASLTADAAVMRVFARM